MPVSTALDLLANAGVSLWKQRWRIAGVLACGTAPGYAWWTVRHRGALERLAANRLDEGEFPEIATAVLVSSAITLVLVAALHLLRRDRARTLGETIDLGLRYGLVTLALPLMAALATPRIETESPWFTLELAVTASTIVGLWTTRLPALPEMLWRRSWLRVWLPATLAIVAAGLFAHTLSQTTLLHHRNLGTSTFDLGIYDSLFWNASRGFGLRSTLVKGDTHTAAHFDPILVLLSPIYRVRPGAETLLVLQAVWIAAGSLPLYLLAQRKLDDHWAGLALVLCYVLHPGIHGATAYHFHSISLAIPLLLAAVLTLELGALGSYAGCIVLLLLVREDVSLLLMTLGLYALLTDRRRVGVLTILASVAYLLVVKRFVMPDPGLLMESSKESYGYASYFDYLIPDRSGGARELLKSVALNPVFVLRSGVTEAKLLYVVRSLGPLLFLPLFARRGRVLLVYGFAFCLLGSKTALYSQHFQYITLHTPFSFALVPIVLANPQQSPSLSWLAERCPQFVRSTLSTCVLLCALVSWKYGAVIENDSFRAGYLRLERGWDDVAQSRYAWLVRAPAQIPPGASVGATDRLVPHLSGRLVIERFPSSESRDLDYLVVDRRERRPKGVSGELRNLERSGAFVRLDAHPSGLVLLERNREVSLPPRYKPPKSKKPGKTK